jgi:hypothetical protein
MSVSHKFLNKDDCAEHVLSNSNFCIDTFPFKECYNYHCINFSVGFELKWETHMDIQNMKKEWDHLDLEEWRWSPWYIKK